MSTLRLTAAQAMVKWLSAQHVIVDGVEVPYFAGVWAIFGHGNVAGLGEALHAGRDAIPTWRAHNEQGMAHAAIAYAKQMRRQRAMVCTTSIGPGATNMITAAALAHVNRLPVLLVPGDVYASRRPDPVLQQLEEFNDATVSVNDCFKPVSRYFDRLMRPEQLLDALPKALSTLLDPANCGPVTLAFCQDVQAEAFDYPAHFFERRVWKQRRTPADGQEIDALVDAVRASKRPLIIAGGGVLYSRAEAALAALAESTGIPVAETQAGKGTLSWQHPRALGSIGVTGSVAANAAAQEADLIIGIGTRLQDFTTGSRSLFPGRRLFQVNVQAFDAHKHGAEPVVGDALAVIDALRERLRDWCVGEAVVVRDRNAIAEWNEAVTAATAGAEDQRLPSDAQVIGVVQRGVDDDTVVVCAAGGLPGELHKLWRTPRPGGYHLEYGFSCMGYEIAGGLGIKMALPKRDVICMIGDGSYMMANSELATAVMMGIPFTVVLTDNRGYGCINRLQQGTGGVAFNNLYAQSRIVNPPALDFVAHAGSMGAFAVKAADIAALEAELAAARERAGPSVIVIDTEAETGAGIGGGWRDVAVPEVGRTEKLAQARKDYEVNVGRQQVGG